MVSTHQFEQLSEILFCEKESLLTKQKIFMKPVLLTNFSLHLWMYEHALKVSTGVLISP